MHWYIYIYKQVLIRSRCPRHRSASIAAPRLAHKSDYCHSPPVVLRLHSHLLIFNRTLAPQCQRLPPLQQQLRLPQLAAVAGHRSLDIRSCNPHCLRPLLCITISNENSRHRILLKIFFLRLFPAFSILLTVRRWPCPLLLPGLVVCRSVTAGCSHRQLPPRGRRRCQQCQICKRAYHRSVAVCSTTATTLPCHRWRRRPWENCFAWPSVVDRPAGRQRHP